jgi:integrase
MGAGLRADDPTLGLHRPKAKNRGGIYTWTDSDIAKFESTFPVGTRERLALALLLETAQRRGDVVRMGRQHVRGDVIDVIQSKTGKALQIPISAALSAAIDASPRDNLTFLTRSAGRPFSGKDFTVWFKRAIRKARLPEEASVHGLRKAAARRLADRGFSANIIAAWTGHASLQEVSRYTAAADQLRLARQGLESKKRTGIG